MKRQMQSTELNTKLDNLTTTNQQKCAHFCVSPEGVTPAFCAHVVLNPHFTTAPGQSSDFSPTLAEVGLSELEWLE
jgi:hypothetical protein